MQDRRYTEGIGYRVGNLELHPGLAGEFGYDSNFLHRSDSEGPLKSLRLRITPSFSVSTLTKQRREANDQTPPPTVEFRGGVSATYNEFFPIGTNNEAESEIVRDQHNVGGNLDLNLGILPGRPWSGTLVGGASRYVNPTNEGLTTLSFNRIYAYAGGELAWTPGSGLFDWRVGYRFDGMFFESERFNSLTNNTHTLSTRGRWRFLPRTALVYDGRFGFTSYPDGGTQKTGSHPVRTQIGINGLVTSRFALLAMAGWGASFYDGANPQDFDSVIGQVEAKVYLTPNPSSDPAAATLAISTLAVGFTRDFFDSYIGSYYERDRAYLNLSWFFGGSFLLVAEGGAAAIRYPPVVLPSGWTDWRIDSALFGEYRVKDSIGLNATLRFNTNISDTAIPGAAGQVDSLQWQELEAYIGARWFM